MMRELLWILPLLPFLGALLNGVVLHGRIGKKGVAWIACATVGLAAVLGLLIIADYLTGPESAQGHPFEQELYSWMPAGAIHLPGGQTADFNLGMGFLLDPLSCVMLFVVTFVGFWIHVYSVGYMAHEEGF